MRHREMAVRPILGLLLVTSLLAGCVSTATRPTASAAGRTASTTSSLPAASPATAVEPARAPAETASIPDGPRVTLLYTNDTYAYVDPCG